MARRPTRAETLGSPASALAFLEKLWGPRRAHEVIALASRKRSQAIAAHEESPLSLHPIRDAERALDELTELTKAASGALQRLERASASMGRHLRGPPLLPAAWALKVSMDHARFEMSLKAARQAVATAREETQGDGRTRLARAAVEAIAATRLSLRSAGGDLPSTDLAVAAVVRVLGEPVPVGGADALVDSLRKVRARHQTESAESNPRTRAGRSRAKLSAD